MAAMSLTLPLTALDSEIGPQSLRRRSRYVTLRSESRRSARPPLSSAASLARFPVEMEEQERLGGVGGRVLLRGRVVAANDWLRLTPLASGEEPTDAVPLNVAPLADVSEKGKSCRLGRGGVESSSSSVAPSGGRQRNGTGREFERGADGLPRVGVSGGVESGLSFDECFRKGGGALARCRPRPCEAFRGELRPSMDFRALGAGVASAGGFSFELVLSSDWLFEQI